MPSEIRFEENKPLKDHNTFGLNVKARYFLSFETVDQLQLALEKAASICDDIMILGGGSNVLFTNDFTGAVLLNAIKGMETVNETEHHVDIKVGAGENWHQFVLYCISNNWGGVENLSLIPGTVGAAPMQNIGAYGVEIKDVFVELEAVNRATGKLETFNGTECQFGYRESIFKTSHKNQYVITSVTFRLNKPGFHELNTSYGAINDTLNEVGIESPTIKDVSDAVIKIRQSKLPDPKEIGNCGSFFKNPSIDKIDFEGLKAEFTNIPGYAQDNGKVKVPAGWLIEQAGWKGLRRGDIGVHKNQALVLVNYGGGNGNELKELAFEIQDSVAEKFGIVLTPEVNII